MAYSAPTSKSSGDVIADTDWNKLVDDILASDVALVTTKGDLTPATGVTALARLAVGSNFSTLTADSSQATGMKWVAPQVVRAERTTNQAIATATETAVQFNATETFDTNALHDTSTNNTRLTASVAGYYLVIGYAKFASDTSGSYNYAKIRKNGATSGNVQRDAQPAASGVTPEMTVMDLVSLSAGDYVELMVAHDKGSNKNVTSATLGMALLWGK